MIGNRIPKIILKWNAEGKRRHGKRRGKCMDRVRRSMINRGLTEEMQRTENCGGAKFLWDKG